MDAQPHVLVANTPASYRSLIAGILLQLRPRLAVVQVDPAALDSMLEPVSPRLVICSRLTERIVRHSAAAIVLYPDGSNEAVLAIAGQRQRLEDPQLADLLTAVDAIVYDEAAAMTIWDVGAARN